MDLSLYLRAVFALVVVLGLIALAAWAARRAPQWRQFALGTPTTRARRLNVVERLTLDPRRQIVILREGTREHVILLGMNGEQLLESRNAEPDAETPALRLIEAGTQS